MDAPPLPEKESQPAPAKPNRFGSYREILQKLQELDQKERNELALRLKIICFSALWSVILLAILAIRRCDPSVFISKEAVTTLLIPAFSYLYNSYQEDVYSTRKEELLNYLIENFDEASGTFDRYTPRQMSVDKIEELIDSLFKNKL